MTKKVIFLLSLMLSAAFGYSQGVMKFISEDKHDFGIVNEGDQATYDFEFVNTGTAPIVLTNVSASCGCTTPSWTREPIPPGGKGSITASYSSAGRPGVFNKSITVTSNATESSKVLYIKGVVLKKEENTNYSAADLKDSPKLVLDKNSHNFGKVERGQRVIYKFTVKNTGKNPLVITSAQSACSCVSHKLSMESIPSGKSAVLEITYNPSFDGENTDIYTLFTNDLNNPKVQIVLKGEVVESLTTTTPLKEDNNMLPFGR